MTKLGWMIVVATVLAIAVLTGVLEHFRSHTAYSAVTCNSTPTEVCPSDQFYTDMQRTKELGNDINFKQNEPVIKAWREEIDLRNGMIERLNPQILEENKLGFKWNDSKGRFVKMTPDEWAQFINAQVAAQTPPKR